jgi:hypothetical protein
MAKTQEDSPQRGALLVSLKPSTSTISAGGNFSISVTITNPFDVPVAIQSISTLLPVDLYDVNLYARIKEQVAAQHEIDLTRARLLNKLGVRVAPQTAKREGILRPIFRSTVKTAIPGGYLLAEMADRALDASASAFATAAQTASEPAVRRFSGYTAKMIAPADFEITPGLPEEEIKQKVNGLLAPLEQEYKARFVANAAKPINIQPGDSITNVFVLRTRKGITFTPTSYNLDVSIQYQVDRVVHNQAVPYSLDIQAAQISVILGAIIGSVFGVLASQMNKIFAGQWLSVLPGAITTIILSAFAVIAFARKAGVQPIIAVQDFWGGMLIGFLVGYSGTQVLGNLFGSTGTAIITKP